MQQTGAIHSNLPYGRKQLIRPVKLVLQHEIKRFDLNLVSVVCITDVNYIEYNLNIVALCTMYTLNKF